MGGKVFENTHSMSIDEYNGIINLIKERFKEGVDFLLPFRLKTKTYYNDVDLIIHDSQKFIDGLSDITSDIVRIDLCKGEFFSYHILTTNNIQIDLLVALNAEGMELFRAYHSYSCSGVFFKRLVSGDNEINNKKNSSTYPFKLGYNGIIVTNRKIHLDTKTYKTNEHILILDINFLFEIMNLNYDRFIEGFNDEFELLEYLKTSKHWYRVYFINNSSYRRDYQRLSTFKNLCDSGFLNII